MTITDEVLPLMPISSTQESTLNDNAGNQESSSNVMIAAASAGSVAATIAALPVPYLVLKSIYYLTTNQVNIPFSEMMKSDNLAFWLLGPAASTLATMAVAPFNIYNTFCTIKSMKSFKLDRKKTTVSDVITMISRLLALSFGLVNGYNMNLAYVDVMRGNSSTLASIAQIVFVGVATLFAGIDSRVVIAGVKEEIPRDYRYFKRGAILLSQKTNFFNQSVSCVASRHNHLLQKYRARLDDFRVVALLSLTESQLKAFEYLLQDTSWFCNPNSEKFKSYIKLMNGDFPVRRYAASELLGSGVSATLSFFSNLNTWTFTKKSVEGFVKYTEITKNAKTINTLSNSFSAVSTVIGSFLGFFLIRDVFFRNVAKPVERTNYNLLLLFIPALCYGLLNVYLTLINDELNPVEKTLVSGSAILGATVVSRYGIEGGMEMLFGRRDLRRDMAKLPELIMNHLKTLSADELRNWDQAATRAFLTFSTSSSIGSEHIFERESSDMNP